MPRKQSDATALREARSRLASTDRALATCMQDKTGYRLKSERLEKELAEWKARFDKLLDRTPKQALDEPPKEE